ncbi:unnamed protein product, partial [Arabidopsis halleri]
MPQRRRLRGGRNIRRFLYTATLLVNLQLLATSYLQAHSVYHLLKGAWHKWLSPRYLFAQMAESALCPV